jgi:DNA-directed RNA polymerase subunit M/transcription elongation factor TFIIS
MGAADTDTNQLSADAPDRGYLPEEPCRHCHQRGGVYFILDDSPFGRGTAQVTACEKCKNSWTADSGTVPA